MMNYPKLGEIYKVNDPNNFVSAYSFDCDELTSHNMKSVYVAEGTTVKFDSVEPFALVHGKMVWRDSLVCRLFNVNNERDRFVLPYRLLVELVQSGAFIKTEDSPTDKLTKILDTNVEDLGFSVRALNVLLQLPEPVTVRRLVSMTERDLLKRRNCGVKVLGEVKAKLTQLGVAFLPPR